ncbi:MAG: helix-turn-helix transcriptional regulator [Proteobacteria bacterium]|jgi:DNA-binding HxlR family transcriptional regulator|nr:helix-turn-helix transcriptional regulator [Pseudomonadota bacterium]
MAGYGQFCPVAKATEIIGEKWTLLVLRELLLGTTRFNDFQRAMSRMSPTLLTKRLRQLEECGIIIRKKLSGQRGYEYRLTAAGKELSPLIEILAVWGMRWARNQLTDDELDVEFLMREIQRRLNTEHLPDGETVICLIFDELTKHKTWWLLVDGDVVDLCTENPGKEVDLYINSSVRACVEVWEGDLDMRTALHRGSIKAQGLRHLIRTMPDWFGVCLYKDVRRGAPILMRQAVE